MKTSEAARILDRIREAGYTTAQAETGVHYALHHRAADETEAFVLAMSRILYSDEQLADGARFAVEA